MSIKAPVNVTFSLSSPGAHAVDVAIFFNDWSAELPLPQVSEDKFKWKGSMAVRAIAPLKQEQPGLWCCELPLLQGWYEYLFLVDGEWVMDPDAPEVCPDGAGGVNAARMVVATGDNTTRTLAGADGVNRPTALRHAS